MGNESRQRLPALAGVAALLILGCDAMSGGSDDDKTAQEAPIPVEVEAVRRDDIAAVYSGTAALEVEAQAEVRAKVGGEIVEILVEEGAAVAAGAVLARVDGERLRLEVERQQANVRRLEQEYKRNLELHERGLVSAGAFEGQTYELEALKAALRLAQLELGYTRIRAPFNGVVSARHVRRGDTVTPNQPVFTVTDLDPLIAYLHVPEKEFNKLAAGQSAVVIADALPGRRYPGQIARISPVVDPATGTFKVTVEVEDDTGKLKPGMFGRVSIVYDRRQQALLVPRAAIVDADTEAAVFVVRDGVAHRRDVRTGYSDGADVEIVDGLSGDEAVVVVGQNSLRDGGKVRVVGPEEPDTRTVVEQTPRSDNSG